MNFIIIFFMQMNSDKMKAITSNDEEKLLEHREPWIVGVIGLVFLGILPITIMWVSRQSQEMLSSVEFEGKWNAIYG